MKMDVDGVEEESHFNMLGREGAQSLLKGDGAV